MWLVVEGLVWPNRLHWRRWSLESFRQGFFRTEQEK